MTDSSSSFQPDSAKGVTTANPSPVPLHPEGIYLCPVCRHGHIQSMVLMDAFACDFCRHIFTPNLHEQTVQVVDSSQPMGWRWSGKNWRPIYQDDFNLTFVIWTVGAGLVALPPSLVWLSSHTFPPMEGSRWSWMPSVWVGLTLTLHFLLVLWLITEHYQFPFYVSLKVKLQHWFGRR